MGLYRILVVDDEEDMTTAVEQILSGAGYEVLVAHDGWDGLALARRHQPDLVLLDVKMPQIDGWTFMKIIRSRRDLAAVPVIFLTASTSAEDREHGLQLGAEAYLTKPVDPEQLLSEVASVLDRRWRGGSRADAGAWNPAGHREPLRMSGRTDQMGLLTLLSILGAGQRTGVLEVRSGPVGDRGRILLRNGRVVSARVEGLRQASGLDAVEVLGKWRDGAFTFIEEKVLISEEAAAVPGV